MDNNDENVDTANADKYDDRENPIVNKHADIQSLDIVDNIFNLDIPVSNEQGSGKQLYKCEECEASYKSRGALLNHTNSKHEGVCYSCKYCGYKATRQGQLKIHQESLHEGVKYPCNQCDYQATQQGSLKRHKKSRH